VGRRRGALAVLFIDLDRFKLVNDRVDHSAGDVVLNEMANRLTDDARVDVVARFGGDEFVAFGEVDNEAAALDMAERIRKGLREPIAVGESHLVVTASIGIVVTRIRPPHRPCCCATPTAPCTRPSAPVATRPCSTAAPRVMSPPEAGPSPTRTAGSPQVELRR